MSGYFKESFDNGIGALNNTWGSGNIDTSVSGEVTIHGGHSGLMEYATGPSAGHGYGTYEVVAKMSADTPGPAVLLWPGDDKWPGPEYDIVEVLHDGRPYGTVHWRGGDGQDAYTSRFFDGVDESQTHTYTLDWQPGKISYYVDGKWMGEVTENVGADYDHGGVNSVLSVMNWNSDAWITVYELTYSPSGSGGSKSTSDHGNAQETIHFTLDTTSDGHVIEGFDQGKDVISFDGFGSDAKLENLGNGDFKLVAADGAYDIFHLPGVTELHQGDYILN